MRDDSPEEITTQDLDLLYGLPARDNPGHARCLATGRNHGPGTHRMRHRPRRPTNRLVEGARPALQRKDLITLAAEILFSAAAVLAALTNHPLAMAFSISLAVLSYAMFVAFVEH